jgi:hypothetical protein
LPNSSPPARPAEIANALRIFAAEARAGHRDGVVIGGLAGYARHLATVVPDGRVQEVRQLLADYGALTPAARAARLGRAQALLGAEGLALRARAGGRPWRADAGGAPTAPAGGQPAAGAEDVPAIQRERSEPPARRASGAPSAEPSSARSAQLCCAPSASPQGEPP